MSSEDHILQSNKKFLTILSWSVICTDYHISPPLKKVSTKIDPCCAPWSGMLLWVCVIWIMFLFDVCPFIWNVREGVNSLPRLHHISWCLEAHSNSQRGGKFKLGELAMSCVKIKFWYPLLFNILSCNIGNSIRSPLRLFKLFLDCMLWKYYWSNQNNVFKQNEV